MTAVEWLYKELALNNNSIDSIKERIYKESEIWKQAKAMEKEQIYSEEDMTNYALYILHNNVITPKEWLKQFKKKQSGE